MEKIMEKIIPTGYKSRFNSICFLNLGKINPPVLVIDPFMLPPHHDSLKRWLKSFRHLAKQGRVNGIKCLVYCYGRDFFRMIEPDRLVLFREGIRRGYHKQAPPTPSWFRPALIQASKDFLMQPKLRKRHYQIEWGFVSQDETDSITGDSEKFIGGSTCIGNDSSEEKGQAVEDDISETPLPFPVDTGSYEDTDSLAGGDDEMVDQKSDDIPGDDELLKGKRSREDEYATASWTIAPDGILKSVDLIGDAPPPKKLKQIYCGAPSYVENPTYEVSPEVLERTVWI